MRGLVIAALVLAFVASACGGSASEEPVLLFGDTEGIISQPIDGSDYAILLPVPSRTDTFRDPALSPDGRLIAYIHVPPYKRSSGGYLDAHADLWVANRDGSEPRMVYEHTRPTETLVSPTWLDETTILAQTTYRVDPTKVGSPNERALLRIDIATGERTEVLTKVIEFALSPDRSRVAFTAIKSIEEQPIYIASFDGQEPVVLVDASSGLGGFSGLVFAADGEAVFFGAHEEDAQARLASSVPIAGRGPRARALRDAPVDLWRVQASGGEPTLVAEMEALAPSFVRGDSAEIIFMLAGWLARIDTATGDVERITDPDVFGGVEFVSR
jgi:Tol biopolymer transport system component